MKKTLLMGTLLLVLGSSVYAKNKPCPTTLVDVYLQSLVSDPTYLQAVAQRLSDREGVPISLSGLLPNASTLITPNITRTLTSGSAATTIGSDSARGYTVNLALTQTVFDFGKYANLAGSRALAKGANATLSAATQNLMVKVAKAYFKILEDQDNLRYILASRTAYAKQLDQAKQQYKVGLKTITDVYTAQASYETSVADYIRAQTDLQDDKENLRAITGYIYADLATLSDNFPLVSPKPADIEAWVTTAGQQNWSIKAKQYAAESARQNIKQQFAGHFPTLNAEAIYNINYSRNTGGSTVTVSQGSYQAHTSTIELNLNIPLVAGGLVVAQTHQAQYNYQVAIQQLEFTLRDTLTTTRQSYLGVLAGISKIRADRESIKSNISSLDGMRAGYRVGTEILVNVLNQQEKVYQAQQTYAHDRYEYVNNLLALKQAAGTLSMNDLEIINYWLR